MWYLISFSALYACFITTTCNKTHVRGPHLPAPFLFPKEPPRPTWPPWLPSPTTKPPPARTPPPTMPMVIPTGPPPTEYHVVLLPNRTVCPPPPPCPPCAPWPVEPEDGGESLRSKTGFYLAVDPNKREVFGISTVKGSGALQVKRRRMRRSTLTDVLRAAVTIKEIKSKLYIAMNATGDVYAESDHGSHNIWWEQSYERGSYRFSWLGNNKTWLLSIREDGKMRRGYLTGWNQPAAQFERNDQGQEKNPYPENLPDDTVGDIPTWGTNATGETDEKQLLGRNNFNLAVNSDGLVYGESTGRYGVRKTSLSALYLYRKPSIFWPRDVQIKGKIANLYVAMDNQGYVYGEPNGASDNTWWKVAYAPGDTNSVIFEWLGNSESWFLGFQSDGRVKRGPETVRSEVGIKFTHPLDVWQ